MEILAKMKYPLVRRSRLWDNTPAMFSRWLLFFLVIIIGIAGGLFYGWVISPVEYVDTTPESLRADYKTDYVIMAAEAFTAEQDVALARNRLELLGDRPAEDIVRDAIQFAQRTGYSDLDRTLLRDLLLALRTESLSPGTPGP